MSNSTAEISSSHSLQDRIKDLNPPEAAKLLSSQPPEVIQDILTSLPMEQTIAIASQLSAQSRETPNIDREAEEEREALLGTIKGTVSELLTEVTGALPPDTTVAGALDYLVHTQPESAITYIYVIDHQDCLLGVVAMRDLLLSRPGQTLEEIMTPSPFSYQLDTSITEAVEEALIRRHRLYPVVDEDNRLKGLLYGWQLFERVATDISAQSGSMVGVDKTERVDTPLMTSFRMRHPWLQVNLVTAFMAALVVGVFEDTIARIVALAVFLPVLAGQSGNTGCQALAITLRGLTLGDLANYPVYKLLRKEICLGAMNGFAVGVVAAIVMWIYAGTTGAAEPMVLAVVILIAMVGSCIGSGIFGVLVPLTLKRFGADPATASSIFLTTFTDILGMGLMLFLATTLVLP